MNELERTILVTGGAGFIGSALVRYLIEHTACTVVNVDKLTYAGNLASLAPVAASNRYHFEQVDICDRRAIDAVLTSYRPHAIMHLAAESHVDRSIDSASAFIHTNIIGTYTLLEAALKFWKGLERDWRQTFRFLHVSTDEVYGSLGPKGAFTEASQYRPNSPYSASKAASDHLVRAWCHTYGLPALTTNCSNNYGPYQFPEKLIPLMTLNASTGKALPIYGTGENVRDWLYVEDHVRALWQVLLKGTVGEVYNIGGNTEKTNRELVEALCEVLDELLPESPFRPHASLITFVDDRPGHDLRYAMDISKIERELNWQPAETFATGLRKTVQWYLEHQDWWQPILDGVYQGERLGRDSDARPAGEP